MKIRLLILTIFATGSLMSFSAMAKYEISCEFLLPSVSVVRALSVLADGQLGGRHLTLPTFWVKEGTTSTQIADLEKYQLTHITHHKTETKGDGKMFDKVQWDTYAVTLDI